MQQIGLILPSTLFPTTGFRIEVKKDVKRKDLIKLFIDKLNEELYETNKILIKQGKTPFKVKTDGYYAFRLSHVKTYDLKPFYDECMRGDSFGKVFYGSLKPVENPLARFNNRKYN